MKKVLVLSVIAMAIISVGCRKEYTISVKTNNIEWGVVSGSGVYAKGEEVIISAKPLSGCQFLMWEDGNFDLNRTIIVRDNATYTAIFRQEGPSQTDLEIHTGIACIDALANDMIKVQGGTFLMGAAENDTDARSDEKPQHSVTLSDYYICKYEVTQELWQAVMDSTSNCNIGWTEDNGLGEEYPAYEVDWNDCISFIQRLNAITGLKFRLPTEAEWEYAARGGRNSKGYMYAGGNVIADVAWYGYNSDNKSHEVMQKKANELGLYDMTGNVFEWCSDWYADDYYSHSEAVNPKGPSGGSYRVCRGGCMHFSTVGCRLSYRYSDYPDCRARNTGFRLALSAEK